jgi:hypothetical protein
MGPCRDDAYVIGCIRLSTCSASGATIGVDSELDGRLP